jgi:hypothetical protein
MGSTPFEGDFFNAIIFATHAGTLDTLDRVAVRQYDTTHGVEHGIMTLPWWGAIDSLGEHGSLNNVIRLSGRNAGQEVSYKLWRMPLRLRDIEGERLSSDCMDIITDDVLPILNSVAFCNINGIPIEEWTCDGLVHSWQLRHGTNRRARPVFAY